MERLLWAGSELLQGLFDVLLSPSAQHRDDRRVYIFC